MKKGLLLLAMFMLMAVSVNALTLKVNYGAPGYSTVSIVCTVADPDSGTTAKKLYIYYDKVKATTLVDSITTVTIPDTFAVTGLDEGAQYFFKIVAFDSATTVTGDVENFTTTNFTQNNTLLYNGYSTAGIQSDSVGFYVAPLDSIVLQYGKVSGTYTIADTITSVTHPDTFAITGLDEGVTYYYRTIAYLADSAIVDSSAQGSFTTTNLSSSITILGGYLDSLVLIVDSVGICPDSLILQWGAGLRGITANADTTTTANCPDTISITGLIPGATYYYRLLYFLADSSAIDTGTVASYTVRSRTFVEKNNWPESYLWYDWEFTKSADYYTTSFIPITSNFIRIHASIDGEDDVATYDSLEIFLWSHGLWGDSTIIDTIIALEVDTSSIVPLVYRQGLGSVTDTSLGLYHIWNWGAFYSLTATMTDSSATGFNDSTIGVRGVHIGIEPIE